MDKRAKNMAKRILAALLSLMLVSGTAVMTPAYKNISSGIVVNAVEPSADFEFSAETVTLTMNGEELSINSSGEVHIMANEENTKPVITVKDGDHTLTNEEVSIEFDSDSWTTQGEIGVNVVGMGAYEEKTPMQFTIIIDLKPGKFCDGEVDIAELKAGDILTKGTTLTNKYAQDSQDTDNFVTTPQIIILAGRYMVNDEIEPAEEDYSTPENFLSWCGNIAVEEETANLILPMYVSGTDGGTGVYEETGAFYPIGEAGEEGDAWQVVSNENGVLVLQGMVTPVLIREVCVIDDIAAVKYTGEAYKPEVTVRNKEDGTDVLVAGEDYLVTYEDNVYAGTAVVTVTGIGAYAGTVSKNFYIMPGFDLSELFVDPEEEGAHKDYDVVAIKADGETVVTPDENGKVYLEPGDIIRSRVELTFVDAGNVPTQDEDDDAYFYRIKKASGKADGTNGKNYNEIRVEHTDVWIVNQNKDYPSVSGKNLDDRYYYLMCGGEKGITNEELLHMTIDRETGVYKYGEHIGIEIIKNLENSWGIQDSDLSVETMRYAPIGQTGGTGILTDMGEYQASVIVYVKQINTNVTLRHNYSVAQKDVAELGYEFSIDDVLAQKKEVAVGENYTEAEVEVASDTTYAHSATHTPSVKLYNWVYNYDKDPETNNEIGYEKVELVEDTDYTVSYVPYKVGDVVQGYTVTVTAKSGSNYKGTKTFNWDIDKQNATAAFTEEDVSFTYNADNTVDTDAFGLTVTAADPTEEDADNVYTLVETVEADEPEESVAGDYTVVYSYETAEGVAMNGVPSEVGQYKVVATFTADNFVIDSVSKEFTITRKEVTVTPESAEITYGDATPTVVYTIDGAVEGGEEVAETGIVVVDGTENTRTGVLDVKRDADDNVVAYGYKFNTDGENAPVVVDGDNFNYGRNYKLVLVTSYEEEVEPDEPIAVIPDEPGEPVGDPTTVTVEYGLTVNPKEITEGMFTFAATELTYNRTEQSVDVSGKDEINEVDFMNGTADYTLGGDLKATNANRIVEGKEDGYVVTATGKGNYTGELTLTQTWKINPKSIAKPEDETAADDINAWSTNSHETYNKEAHTPVVKVTDGSAELVEKTEEVTDGEFVVLEHDDFINAGEYDFQIEGVGNYKDTRTVKFIIGPVKAEDIELKIIGESAPTYDGETIVDEYYAVATDVDEEEYDFEYAWFDAEGNEITADDEDETIPVINAGTYTLVATATGSQNYEDKTVEKTITIQKRHTDIYPLENQSIEYGEDTENVPIAYDFEPAEGNRGVVAADIDEETGKDTVDFSRALRVNFTSDNVGTYYIYVVDEVEFDNYIIDDLDYAPEFKIVPKQITRDMFTLTLDNSVLDPVVTAGADYDAENVPSIVFSGKKITATVTSDKLETPKDFRVSGTKNVYASSVEFDKNYKTEIYGQGNYTGYVDFDWAVNKELMPAKIVVEKENIYDGTTPEIEVVRTNDSQALPSDAVVTLSYFKLNRKTNKYEALTEAPVDAGQYKVTAEITSRNYDIGAAEEYFHISRELHDGDIKIATDTVTAFDFGVASVDGVEVVLDGTTKLEKGVDYELGGTVETNVPGKYTVQIIGTEVDYFGIAVAEWELTEDGEDKQEAIADITGNVTVDFARGENGEVDVDGQFLNGRKNILLGLDVAGADGETYKVIKQGIVYYNGEGEPVELTENSKAASKKGTSYLIPDIGNGITARAYAVVAKVVSTDEYGDNGYQTTLYSDVYNTTYGNAVKYTTTVTGGTVVGTSADSAVEGENGNFTVVYHGYDMADRKRSIAVVANEAPEGQKFAYWQVDGGKIVSMTPEYSFIVSERQKNLEAVFVGEDEEIVAEPIATVSVRQDKADTTTNTIKFGTNYSVPSDKYTTKSVGVYYANNKQLGYKDTLGMKADLTAVLEGGSKEVKNLLLTTSDVKFNSTEASESQGEFVRGWNLGTNIDVYVYALGVIVAENKATGEEETFYSDVVATTYNLAE